MGLGNDHFLKILTELHKKGIDPTNEEIRELKVIANQIDDLYEKILESQAAMGANPFKVLYNGPIPTYHPGTGEFTGNITVDQMLEGATLIKGNNGKKET